MASNDIIVPVLVNLYETIVIIMIIAKQHYRGRKISVITQPYYKSVHDSMHSFIIVSDQGHDSFMGYLLVNYVASVNQR